MCQIVGQQPGAKLKQDLLIWSRLQGTGKNKLAEIIRHIYGTANYREIDCATLGDGLNGFMRTQFLIVNEVHMPKLATQKVVDSKLKTYISQPVSDLNQKNIKRSMRPNFANIYLTSNKPDALVLDDT